MRKPLARVSQPRRCEEQTADVVEGVRSGMRLLALALTGILASGPAFAQEGQSAPPPSSADDERANLPVSLDKIKQGLEQPVAEPLRGIDERPHFRVQIQERQRIDELLSTLKFDSGPAVPGGLYGNEVQRQAYPSVQNPLMQPYSAFTQGQLATVLIENLLFAYYGPQAVKHIAEASRAREEAAAREEVRRALAEFCATHDCSQ